MATFAQDVRYAVRLLLKHPGFSFITILVLALGIGATTAIFSIVDAVLLRSLPYPEPNRLVSVQLFWKQFNQRGTNVSAPDFHDWHDQATSFDGLAAYFGGQTSVRIGDTADYAGVIVASPDFFSVMGARTQLGRLLTAEEHQPGSQLAAVVSDGFWRSHLGADPGVIGRTLKFRERLYTIVGVMVPEFRFPANTDLWTPWWPIPETPSRSAHNYLAVARLKRGVTLAQAQADMDAIGARLEQTYPQSNESKGIVLDLLQDQMVRNTRTTLQLVFGVVITVLLIACANVSSLLLARASSRSRELGVRAAIGATRGRMVRQLVTESALLAIVSGGLGVLIAAWGLRGLIAIAPPGLPRIEEVAVDMRMLGFSLAVSVAASFVFGLAPALQTSRVDLNEVLKQAGRGAAARGMGRLRAALIVFETAAAVALVIAAALLVRSFAALAATDVGFRADHLLVAETTVPSADLDAAKRAIGFYRNLTPQLAAIPGVQRRPRSARCRRASAPTAAIRSRAG